MKSAETLNKPKTVKNEIFLILLLASIQFTNIMDFMIMMPLQDYFLKQFGIETGVFSLILSSYSIAAAIAALVGANFIDRFNRKSAAIFLYTGFLVGTTLCALADSYMFLLFARVAAGIFGGMVTGVVLSIIGDVFPIERRGRAMGGVMGAFSAASVLGVPSGLRIAMHFGWNYTFGFIVVLGLPILVLAVAYLPSLPSQLDRSKPSDSGQFKKVISDPNHLRAFAFFMSVILGGLTVVTSIAVYMERNMGFSKTDVSSIYEIGGIFTFVSSWVIGTLSDKFGKHKVFVNLVLVALVPILLITHLPKNLPIYLTLTVTTFFMVVVSGRVIPAMALLTSSVRPELRGSFMTLNSSLQNVATGIGALLAGAILVQLPDGSFERFDIVGYFAIGFNLLALYLSRKIRIVS
ncbi:MFS transporter [Leptospira wolffii]|uniref:MFS transporter n=1 Tax=Leptospira wolffii TaxID=409998 RepID=UPI001082AF1C|nr:MFS transporter [Leptospira wolffii]TGK59350.1 MFS transporter [Leptospira wolffii]TGK71267.1 MFS transporter [Leptospira wolffii]TGK77834.1 MFS transporter [Leptospira wolffii]TGL29455.1 MFS transporter [Leptospira wolffii]